MKLNDIQHDQIQKIPKYWNIIQNNSVSNIKNASLLQNRSVSQKKMSCCANYVLFLNLKRHKQPGFWEMEMFVRYDCKDNIFHNILNLLVQLQIHAGIYLGLGLGLFIFQDLLILRKFCLLIHTN